MKLQEFETFGEVGAAIHPLREILTAPFMSDCRLICTPDNQIRGEKIHVHRSNVSAALQRVIEIVKPRYKTPDTFRAAVKTANLNGEAQPLYVVAHRWQQFEEVQAGITQETEMARLCAQGMLVRAGRSNHGGNVYLPDELQRIKERKAKRRKERGIGVKSDDE